MSEPAPRPDETLSEAPPREAPDDRERVRRRRSRSIAIAALLAALVILFYVITVLKLAGESAIPDI